MEIYIIQGKRDYGHGETEQVTEEVISDDTLIASAVLRALEVVGVDVVEVRRAEYRIHPMEVRGA